VTSLLRSSARVEVGPGDDAAVVAAPDGRVVVTTDTLVEGVHFRRDWSSAYDVGRKAAAQNLADVVAMGARPTALVVAFAAPGDLPLAWAEDLMRGLVDEAAVVAADVVGGDVVRAPQIVVSVTALGDLDGRPPVLRSGARSGDVLVLAGRPGRSAAGLAVLRTGDTALATRYADVVRLHRAPAPPYETALALARLGATAMIDTSDGLSSELHHLAEASGVALRVDADDGDDALVAFVDEPLRQLAERLGADPVAWLLHGGEDHAFLATVPADLAAAAGGLALPLGRVVAGSGVTYRGAPLPPRGWDHFRGET
jgi:thiamine-monophosphate kinase